jgi:hypothetical protein
VSRRRARTPSWSTSRPAPSTSSRGKRGADAVGTSWRPRIGRHDVRRSAKRKQEVSRHDRLGEHRQRGRPAAGRDALGSPSTAPMCSCQPRRPLRRDRCGVHACGLFPQRRQRARPRARRRDLPRSASATIASITRSAPRRRAALQLTYAPPMERSARSAQHAHCCSCSAVPYVEPF